VLTSPPPPESHTPLRSSSCPAAAHRRSHRA
jgi:hypothetical protein